MPPGTEPLQCWAGWGRWEGGGGCLWEGWTLAGLCTGVRAPSGAFLKLCACPSHVRLNLQCPMSFEMRITHLTEPIDVYHEWLDKCEEANA